MYKNRKNAKHVKMSPNLTKERSNILYEASKLTEDIGTVEFVFANIHGNLVIRFKEKQNGSFLHDFSNMEDLRKLLLDLTGEKV